MISHMDNIPTSLKSLPNWVAWQYENRGQKMTKVPKNPKTGNNAATNYPDTWGAFDEALQACQRWNLAGVGFVLNPAAINLVGVDIDHCIAETGRLSEFAAGIVAELASYTEITPSGRGLRIFVYGQLPPGGRKKSDLGFEMYDQGRFLTVTGNHLPGTPTVINERSEAIQAIHRRIFGTPAPIVAPPLSPNPANMEDDALIEKARSAKNGDKFTALWTGNFSGYASQSEADLALCNLLAFWTGGDADRIDRLFRQSGLYRPKWGERHAGDGRTYGQMTIGTALAQTTEYYQAKTPPVPLPTPPSTNGEAIECVPSESFDPEPLFADAVSAHQAGDLAAKMAALKALAQFLAAENDIVLIEHYTEQLAQAQVIKKGPFRTLLKQAAEEAEQQKLQTLRERASTVEIPASWPYTAHDQKLYFNREKRVGDVVIPERVHVADFVAWKVKEITSENGSKIFKIEGETAYGRKFGFEISADDYTDEKKLKAAVVEAGGAKARIMAGMARHLQPAIDSFTIANNGDLQQHRKFDRTGWAGEQFLLPGMQPDEIIIELPRELPYGANESADFEQGMAALEALLLAAPKENSTIVLAFIFQAPLAHLCGWAQSDRYALFLAGQTGTFKTSFSQCAMAVYGAGFVDDTALVRWGDGGTRNAIMRLATHAHDLPFLVDNFKPNTGGGEKSFYSLLHAILEGGEKARLNRASELRERREIRAWPIITGEDLPDKDPASLARLLRLEWTGCDAVYLTKAQHNAHHLNAVGVTWLRWLKSLEGQAVIKKIAEKFEKRRHYWANVIKTRNKDAQNAMRLATNLAINELTYTIMSHSASPLQEVVNRHGLPEAHKRGLEHVAGQMADQTATSLEATRFLEILKELLVSERYVLEGLSPHSPLCLDADRLLGWEDERGVYLLPEMVRTVVDKFLGRDGLGQVTNTKLYEQLETLDVLARKDSSGKRLVQKKVRGQNQRVLHLKPSALFGNPEE